MQQHAAERDQELRNAWIGKLAIMEAEKLVFLDESAANERSAHRKYGWAPVGITPHEYKSIKRSEHWSILPAYTADGFMSLLTGSWKQGCDPCHKNQGIIFVPVISRCSYEYCIYVPIKFKREVSSTSFSNYTFILSLICL